ncbi:hypothetical protein HC02_23935 [Vibrio parahaemolyticus]|nr:hypothetical protein HC02_23935 [Vibrio parahaemolyticus]
MMPSSIKYILRFDLSTLTRSTAAYVLNVTNPHRIKAHHLSTLPERPDQESEGNKREAMLVR